LIIPALRPPSPSVSTTRESFCGGYSDGARCHGVVLHGTTYSTKDYPGSAGSEATTINNAGEAVGTYSLTDPLLNSGVLGYSMNGSAFTSVEIPSAVETWAEGVNDNGDIVGEYLDSKSAAHGFTLISGSYATIDFPHAAGTVANEINDSGQIAGYYAGQDSTVDLQGSLATPVSPAPTNAGTALPASKARGLR